MDASEIKAILDEDFENLLKKLGIYDSVITGAVECEYCHDAVNIENISMVFPKDGLVCVCCDKKKCTDELLKQRGICE